MRMLPTAAWLVVVLTMASCGKTTTTTTPSGAGGAGTEGNGPKTAGVDLRYPEQPVKLREKARIDFTTTGGGSYAQATMDVEVSLALGGGEEAIEIDWTVVGMSDLQLQGVLEPAAAAEPRSWLEQRAKGTWLIDRRGLADPIGTDALPGNAPRLEALAKVDARLAERRAAGEADPVPPPEAALLKLLPELLEVPRLPGEPLARGASVEYEQTRETALTGTELVVPTQSTLRFTLVNIQEGGGTRLAELSFEGEDWGGLELEDGDVKLANRLEGTMLFDVDRSVPVQLSYTREETLEAGDFGYDTTKIVEVTFERVDG